jgi:hypothetical protein
MAKKLIEIITCDVVGCGRKCPLDGTPVQIGGAARDLCRSHAAQWEQLQARFLSGRKPRGNGGERPVLAESAPEPEPAAPEPAPAPAPDEPEFPAEPFEPENQAAALGLPRAEYITVPAEDLGDIDPPTRRRGRKPSEATPAPVPPPTDRDAARLRELRELRNSSVRAGQHGTARVAVSEIAEIIRRRPDLDDSRGAMKPEDYDETRLFVIGNALRLERDTAACANYEAERADIWSRRPDLAPKPTAELDHAAIGAATSKPTISQRSLL